MRLDREFIRLPHTFDAARLAEEVAQFDESDWRPHPHGYPGNSALPLVAVDGDPSSDAIMGAMRPTPHLDRCPYLREVLASFRAPIGRTRLMRIDGNAEATAHVDTNYYWLSRVRIHVPIVTDPAVIFTCGTKSMHMKAGEAWIFDTWRLHSVVNPNPTRRIHLVIDTKLTSAGEGLSFEDENFPIVMSPDEQRDLLTLFDDSIIDSDDARAIRDHVTRFLDDWSDAWQRHAERRSGWPEYEALRAWLESAIEPLSKRVPLSNGIDAAEAVRQMFIRPALNPELAKLRRPVIIVSPPRSGSTMLFEALAQSPDFLTIGGESHVPIEGLAPLHPAHRGWDSNRLTAADATKAIAESLEARFVAELRDRDGTPRLRPHPRLLEKTPKNALRIPFLRAIWPDASFIYLYRDPRATMSSMLDAWRSGRFVTYPDLPGWEGSPWSLALIPSWRELIGKPLAEIVATQWATTTNILLDDLEALPPESWCVASYDALVRDPQAEIERLCRFVGVRWDRQLTAPLPSSKHTLTAPDPDKWRRNREEIDGVFASLVAPAAERAQEIFARPPARRVRVQPQSASGFRSVHTTRFPEILSEVKASLLVSTYQSGRLVMFRADDRALNTHLRAFPSPMGVAVGPQSIALGTLDRVWDYRNQPDVARRLEPKGKHDACFVPRNAHLTGDIRIHEIAFDAQGELWIVNTRFSSLCTLDRDHSFVPRWRPPFVTHLSPDDRCHLNGLAIIDGRPRFVTALGETNDAHGWRANKASGGVLIDIDSGESLVRGLSMPHSPRWYAGRMWILESGRGTLATIDLAKGRVETVIELPGFTRGLAFAGPYAFVGLSQVRESNVFGGIPLTERLKERSCGVWIIDLRSGAIVAFVKFEDAVQEIFDVQVLHGVRYPELLEPDAELLRSAYVLPDAALAEVAH